MNLLAQVESQLPKELAVMAQQMTQQHAQIPIPTDLSYPASAEMIAASHPEMVLLVAAITNTGRLPVTIQRCQWQTSNPVLLKSQTCSLASLSPIAWEKMTVLYQ